MKNSIRNARRAAKDRLWAMGYNHDTVDSAGVGIACAAYIRSLVQDGDLGYLTELLVEHNDGNMLKIFTLLAQCLETNRDDQFTALGSYTADLAATYLGNEIDDVISELQEVAA